MMYLPVNECRVGAGESHVLDAGWFMEYTRGGKKVRKEGESLSINVSHYVLNSCSSSQ